MSSSLKLRSLQKSHEEDKGGVPPRLPTAREMWILTIACLWFVSGLFLDGWAHNHIPELESFFTPWHAVFYSGYFVTASSLLLIVGVGWRKRGDSLRANIPEGFGHALLGAGLFLLGGMGDLAWHVAFGIEADIEALLSPTHLILAVSMMLMVSTGLRVWFRTTPPIGVPKIASQLPMIFSAVYVITLVWFMTQFSHFIIPRAGGLTPESADVAIMSQNIAITGYLFHIIIMTGMILLITRRARIASGGLTLLFTLSVLTMALMRDGLVFVPAAAIAGMSADILARRFHPFEIHRTQLRMFGFIVPAVFFTAYFLTLSLRSGIWWSVHLWTGSIVMSGLAGLLMTFLVLPPKEWGER